MKLQVYQVHGILHIHNKEVMAIKEIYCDSCEATFTIEYEMLGHQYAVKFCPFCKSKLDDDLSHEIEIHDDDPYEI
tara:strand:+ start:14 stop:241 length:228 start_codon:yes stop_codon:yes gene_type:complete